MPWEATEINDDLVIIAPLDDLVEHERCSEDCVCGPSVEIIQRYNMPDAHMIVHEALDGRK